MRIRCIYCLQLKHEAEFNREHVIPQSFGRFDAANLVITCVCAQCNKTLGRELDEKLARDTVEGIDRVKSGLKPAKDFRTLGRKSTTRVEVKQGPSRGVAGFYVPASDGPELLVQMLPCIGFSKNEVDDFTYHSLENLPTKEEVVASLGLSKGDLFAIRIWELPFETALAALEKKGFPRLSEVTEVPVPTVPVHVETVGFISHPEFRAATKIALNYLAAVTSPELVRNVVFNEPRAYVRHDLRPADSLVSVIQNPWRVTNADGGHASGHYISLSIANDCVVVQISLLLRLRYVVNLWGGGFPPRFTQLASCAHFFDLDTLKVIRIPPLPLRAPAEGIARL